LTSVQTLREYNRSVAVTVFVHGEVPPELPSALAPFGVTVHPQGSYEARLASYCPHGWPLLAHYPVLHKLLNFTEIAALGPKQVLSLDCDTLFFGDVQLLFDRYATAHCYAREEPTCRRSHYGYDRSYVNEEALATLARMLGLRAQLPFNVGVVLFNHGICSKLASLQRSFVAYAWRLLLWLAANPSVARIDYGEGDAVRSLRRALALESRPSDKREMLPYPSVNEWILDEVALWLTLGHLHELTYDDFSPQHVLQNGELLEHSAAQPDWILGHYYTQNMPRIEEWLQAGVR
jgi:hypothetical protein